MNVLTTRPAIIAAAALLVTAIAGPGAGAWP